MDRRQGSDRARSAARTDGNTDQVNDMVLRQEDQPQTHSTVREISRKTGIPRSSVVCIIRKDLKVVQLKCFKRRRAQERTEANWTARKLLPSKFSSLPRSSSSLQMKRRSLWLQRWKNCENRLRFHRIKANKIKTPFQVHSEFFYTKFGLLISRGSAATYLGVADSIIRVL